MKVGSRASVASSFTIIKGALIEETYAVFARWDLRLSKKENLDILRETNFIGASSTTWLRDVAKVLNRRFEPAERDRALVVLAQGGCSLHEWKPVLLWHMTVDEFLLRDFLQSWLFEAHESGVFRIRPDDVELLLHSISSRGGETEHAWTSSTSKRVAAGLLKIATDFGLLEGSSSREFAPYHLPERSFLYLLHALRDQHENPGKILSALDWRTFLMRPSDVERELLRLHQYRLIRYEVAGSIVDLSLPHDSALSYAHSMVA